MSRSNSIMSSLCVGMMFLAVCLVQTIRAESSDETSVYSPVVNGEALRGLSTVTSAEPMGAGRISFSLMAPWYWQRIGYLNNGSEQVGYNNSPNLGANIFTGTAAFSYGVNSYVDLFASVVGFLSNNYVNTDKNAGLGTIEAGAQGSLPFPQYAFIRMGGQAAIIGGTSQNQINTYRADGYNYFDTRTGYDVQGKLMQTFLTGNEDYGIKFHVNEAGVVGLNQADPTLLLLGAGLQANAGFLVIGAEINSRTEFNDVKFATDPLWFTPSLFIRTPFQMNIMAGADISLSGDRPDNAPRALEPYRVFGDLAFSLDMLAGRRNAEAARKQRAAQEKIALENKAKPIGLFKSSRLMQNR